MNTSHTYNPSSRQARVIQFESSRKNPLYKQPLFLDKLIINSSDKIELLPIDQILYLKSESNYTHIYLKDGSHRLVSKCMKHIQSQLPEYNYFKIHQSYIIDLKSLSAYHYKEGSIELISGIMLPVSKSHKKQLIEKIKN